MDKFLELAKLTKASYILGCNEPRGFYEDPKEYYTGKEHGIYPDQVGEIDWSLDIYEIQVYPKTPVGFIKAISNDLDALLDWAIEGAKNY